MTISLQKSQVAISKSSYFMTSLISFVIRSQSICTSALKPGWVTRVLRVTFCPGHLGQTRMQNYPGLTRTVSRASGNGKRRKSRWFIYLFIFLMMGCFSPGHSKANHWRRLHLLKKKNAKGSRAWEQFRIVVGSSNSSEVLMQWEHSYCQYYFCVDYSITMTYYYMSSVWFPLNGSPFACDDFVGLKFLVIVVHHPTDLHKLHQYSTWI